MKILTRLDTYGPCAEFAFSGPELVKLFALLEVPLPSIVTTWFVTIRPRDLTDDFCNEKIEYPEPERVDGQVDIFDCPDVECH